LKKFTLSTLLAISFFLYGSGNIFAQSGGTGTSGDPYLISNLADLQWLSNSANSAQWASGKYFEQTADIDAAGATPAITPIGNGTTQFSGNYDGGYFTIDNLTISGGTADYQGLFGYTLNSTIQNVVLTNVNISGASYVGGLVGYAQGMTSSSITSCGVSGTVTGTTNNVGGLIGSINGSVLTVSTCWSSADATAGGQAAGGLIGFCTSSILQNCYATGNAAASVVAGGFLGWLNAGTINNCYATGTATDGIGAFGGFIGYRPGGTTTNCFWNTTTGTTPGVGYGGSTTGVSGLTSTQMLVTTNFTGFDFTNIWAMDVAINSGFPIMIWQLEAIPPVPLVAPTNLAFSVTGSSLDISWTDTNTGESGYWVENSLDDITYTVVATLPENTETTILTGLPIGLNYFKVYAISGTPVVKGPEATGTQEILLTQKTVSSTYMFSTGATYGNMQTVGASTYNLIGPNEDNATSGVQSLPFVFNYLGQTYTKYSVTENGLLLLMNDGDTPLDGTETTNSMAASSLGPIIAPYWDDLATGTDGYVKAQVYTFYSTVFTVNWRVTVPKSTGGTTNAEFQVKLSAGGSINFNYGASGVTFPTHQSLGTNTGEYSIGIGNTNTDFASVTVTAPQTASTCSFVTSKDNNTQAITGPFTIYFNPDNTAPVISAETIPNAPGTGNRSLVKTITDAGKGVPLSGIIIPRIYYNKNGGSDVSTPGVLNFGTSANSNWTFTVDHSLVGGVVGGDVINYFVVAQDNNLNVSSNPAGVVATNVNTITTPPTPSSYSIPRVNANIKVFLEGPYNGAGGMTTTLNTNTLIPLNSNTAYSTETYGYTESTVGGIPNTDIVDWVLLELRSDETTVVSKRAAFLKSDGTIVDVDGTSPVSFTGLTADNYYVVVRHRNHLAIMSATAIPLSSSSVLYDFTTTLQSPPKAYGTNPMVALSGGGFGMIAADANVDGTINATDLNTYWIPQNGTPYDYQTKTADFTLDATINATDLNTYWIPNNGKATQVPVP
jgi:hypothetical protein